MSQHEFPESKLWCAVTGTNAGCEHNGARIAASGTTVVAPALILWIRQTPDALMGVSSILGAFLTVSFWCLPSIVIIAVRLRARVTIVVGGTIATASNAAVWWTSARDEHSTASLPPAFVGWFLVPIILVFVHIIENWIIHHRAKSSEHQSNVSQ